MRVVFDTSQQKQLHRSIRYSIQTLQISAGRMGMCVARGANVIRRLLIETPALLAHEFYVRYHDIKVTRRYSHGPVCGSPT